MTIETVPTTRRDKRNVDDMAASKTEWTGCGKTRQISIETNEASFFRCVDQADSRAMANLFRHTTRHGRIGSYHWPHRGLAPRQVPLLHICYRTYYWLRRSHTQTCHRAVTGIGDRPCRYCADRPRCGCQRASFESDGSRSKRIEPSGKIPVVMAECLLPIANMCLSWQRILPTHRGPMQWRQAQCRSSPSASLCAMVSPPAGRM